MTAAAKHMQMPTDHPCVSTREEHRRQERNILVGHSMAAGDVEDQLLTDARVKAGIISDGSPDYPIE